MMESSYDEKCRLLVVVLRDVRLLMRAHSVPAPALSSVQRLHGVATSGFFVLS